MTNVIERTQVGNVVVSTVRLSAELRGLDNLIQSFGQVPGRADLSEPGDYETMVFECDNEGEVTDWTEKDFARYDSEDLAREGHELMVERWKGSVKV